MLKGAWIRTARELVYATDFRIVGNPITGYAIRVNYDVDFICRIKTLHAAQEMLDLIYELVEDRKEGNLMTPAYIELQHRISY